MPVCAIYARVSTDKQGESVSHQISFLRDLTKRRGPEWKIDERFVYEDDGIPGTSMIKRPAVMQLIQDAQLRKFDVVLFKGISRFSRDIIDAVLMLRVLREIGIRVVSFEENYDSDTTKDDLLFTIHAAVAQHESEKIAIRVRVGQFELAKQGKWVKGPPPIGYAIDKSTQKLVVNEDESKTVQLIFDLYINSGYGMKSLAQYLNSHSIYTRNNNPWSQMTVRQVLTNEIYLGRIVYGAQFIRTETNPKNPTERRKVKRKNPNEEEIIRIENAHPPIIDERSFEYAQYIIKSRYNKGSKGAGHVLTGLLHCPKCGSGMIAQKRSAISSSGETQDYLYYTCRNKFKYGTSTCNQPNVNGVKIERAVIGYLDNVLGQRSEADIRQRLMGDTKNSARLSNEDLLKSIDKKVADIDAQMKHANAKNFKGIIDDDALMIIMRDLKDDKNALLQEKIKIEYQIENRLSREEEIDKFIHAIRSFKKLLTHYDPTDDEYRQQMRTYLNQILNKIVYNDGLEMDAKYEIETLLTSVE